MKSRKRKKWDSVSKPEPKPFRCPWCTTEISVEYMRGKVQAVPANGSQLLVCIGCAEQYMPIYRKTVEAANAQGASKKYGLSAETILKIRAEQREYAQEDEKKVDEEVDVMNKVAVEKAFKDSRDPLKKPIEVMQHQFKKGLQKEWDGKIIIPGSTVHAESKEAVNAKRKNSNSSS